MLSTQAFILIEATLFFGGLIGFAAYQLIITNRMIAKDQAEAAAKKAEAERTETAS